MELTVKIGKRSPLNKEKADFYLTAVMEPAAGSLDNSSLSVEFGFLYRTDFRFRLAD